MEHNTQPQDLQQDPTWVFDTTVEFGLLIGMTEAEAWQFAARDVEAKFGLKVVTA
ncbi:hypothetical protein [Deinococcus misasensis]|uniref:hypothetical protein n=1 Tax=Deinococcus misasensis TaxID=392413 RepID=UPI000AC2D054|nr:hypothetical protein [Deinococcus misasensis]